jgi:hypothetical protein
MRYLAVLLFMASAWGAQAILKRDTKGRKPILTLSVCVVLASSLIAQLLFPQLLVHFRRDATRIFAGDWWRIATALLFQDGWLLGGLSNIATLFWIGSTVEQVRSRWNWLLIGFSGALLAECVALRWQPSGAGNSVFTCSLAGSLLFMPPYSEVSPASWIPKIAAVGFACFLVINRDLHGVAGIAGIVLGALLKEDEAHKSKP